VRSRKTVKRGLFVLTALAVAVILAVVLAYPRLEIAPLWYDVIGVDVSNHQGDIDWEQLARSKVAFVYMKATEGGDFRDRRFKLNWEGAKNARLPRGAYHFFTQCRKGAEQAKNFIETVPREEGALPPVVDLEHMGSCRSGPQLPNVMEEIMPLLNLLEVHYGRRPVIYTTDEFDAAYLQGQLANDVFWVRSLHALPRFRKDQWVIWQYHDSGTRPGITGPVDLNAFRGSRSDFLTFASGSRAKN
jgi:lysozyme